MHRLATYTCVTDRRKQTNLTDRQTDEHNTAA